MRQLQHQNKDLEEATPYLQHLRLEKKEQQNLKHGICVEKLVIRGIVLLHNTRHKKDKSWKLSFKWLRLYQICNIIKNKSMYFFEEFDGSQKVDGFANNKLKKFYFC